MCNSLESKGLNIGTGIPYRSDVDGLRAIAVLSVIAYHFFPGLANGGFVGVDIFFVISGYLISSIIYRELETDRFSILEFYVRRIRRIYPALFLVLIVVSIVGWFLPLPYEFVRLGKFIAGGATFSSNLVLWRQSGYFSPDASEKPLMHLWSLGVEEQFYLIFPLICILFYRKDSRRLLMGTFLAISAISMALNVAFLSEFSSAVFLMPITRFWELFMGAGISLLAGGRDKSPTGAILPDKWQNPAAILGIALIAIAVTVFSARNPFPGWRALLPTAGTAFCIAAGPAAWFNRRILSSAPVVFIGLISYPLYMWHWPFYSYLTIASKDWGFEFSPLLKGAAVAATFLLAFVTYKFFEAPIRAQKDRKKRRKGALWLLVSVSCAGAFGGFVLLTGGWPSRLPGPVVALDHDYESEEKRDYRARVCFLELHQTSASFGDSCVDAEPAGKPLVLVWGDSHAADLFAGFRAMQIHQDIRLAQFTASLCAPVLGRQVPGRLGCDEINQGVYERIERLKPDVVVLSALWTFIERGSDRDRQAALLSSTIQQIKKAGVQRVVVLGSAPLWSDNVPRLVIASLRNNPALPAPSQLPRTLLRPLDDSLLQAAALRGGADYVPILPALCDQTSCEVTTGPTWKDLVYYDNQHLSRNGSILVLQRIWNRTIGDGP